MFGSPAACRYCCGRPSRKSAAALPVYCPLKVKLPFGRLMNASAMRSRRTSTPPLTVWRPSDLRQIVGDGEHVVDARRERLLRVAQREEAVDADVGQAERGRVARRDREAEVARIEAAGHVRLGVDAVDRHPRLVRDGRPEHRGARDQRIEQPRPRHVAGRREVGWPEGIALLGAGGVHARQHLVRVVDVVVEPHAELVPAIEDVRRLRVAVARLVRQRHVVVEELRRDAVEARRRDHVAWERLSRQRIADRRSAREVAGPLRRARHHARVGGAAPVAKALVVAEHEGAVLDDRPAGGAAELVLIEGRLGHGEAVARLEGVVAVEPPAGAAPLAVSRHA